MNSRMHNQLSSKTCPNLTAVTSSHVSNDIRKVESDSKTLRRLATRNFDEVLNLMTQDDADPSKITPRAAADIKNNMTNEAINQTPSPILLKYCKELLENFNVVLRPIFIKGEPFLSNEDTELLSQIVESNEHYGYLSDNDANLLKQILDLNLSQQTVVKEKSSPVNSESDGQSEVQLLETLFIEEINEFDEKEFAWEVVEEIFSPRSDIERKYSQESLVEKEVVEIKSQESLHSDKSVKSDAIKSPAYKPSVHFSSTILSDITEEEIIDSVTVVNSIPHFVLGLKNDDNEAMISDIAESLRKAVKNEEVDFAFDSEIEILEPDDPEYFYDDILRDFEVLSEASTPVSPPSLTSVTTSTSAKESFTSLELRLSPITQRTSTADAFVPNTPYNGSGDDLFTDPAYKKTEEQLIEAIISKISQTRDLPLTLSVKTVKLYDIRRQRLEFIVIFIGIPVSTVNVLQKTEEICLCEEYEIKLMTFEDLLKVGKFYNIDFKTNEIQVEATNFEDVACDPYKLIKMMKPLKKPPVPMKLVDKIRNNYEKYEDIFDDDVELDLFSAKSESDTDEDLYSTRSLNAKVDTNRGTNSSSISIKDLKVANSKPVGILFDNENYDPQLSGRSKKSTYVQRTNIEDRMETNNENEFARLLEEFYKVDPDTILDLYNYLSASQPKT